MERNFEITNRGKTVEFTLRLAELHELFDAPEVDAFVDQPRVTAGVDDMTAYLFTQRLRNPPQVTATLLLPIAAALPNAAAVATAAMQRYCDAQIANSRRIMAVNTFNGRTKLPVGLLVSAAMVAAVFVLFWLLPDHIDALAALVIPIITIASWAAIWNPVETLLYENWDERRSVQVYTCLRNMKIVVKAED